MDKNAIKKYAVWARRELIARVSQKALQYGITEKDCGDPNADGINGTLLSDAEKKQRKALIAQINEKGYEQVMEEVAYTWFNRFSALRFMEVNGYLPSHVRVFTDESNNFKPQIITEAIHLELDGLNMEKVYTLKDENKTDELYKYLLITQCNALSSILPGMFQKIEDYTELLFPENLLRDGSAVQQMIELIPEEDWKDAIQIIGWLYQYYNTEQNDFVYDGSYAREKISKELIPAATTIYTPDWAVRYMVENSLGALWLDGHPNDKLKANWKYHLDQVMQSSKVEEEREKIRKEYENLKPEDIKCIDPCSGSGHILAYLFDVLMQIYEAYGYTTREAVASIVENNIYGLDIDDRAAQLANFAIMMKARQYDRRFFSHVIQPKVYAIEESNHIDSYAIDYFANGDAKLEKAIKTIVEEMHDAKEYGSILTISPQDWSALFARFGEIETDISMYRDMVLNELLAIVKVAESLAIQYDVVVTNPPYLGSSRFNNKLSEFAKRKYADEKADLSMVMYKKALSSFVRKNGYVAFITTSSWMFLSSFEKMRSFVLKNYSIESLVDFGTELFEGKVGHNPIVSWVTKNTRSIGNFPSIRLTEYCYARRWEKEYEFFNPSNMIETKQTSLLIIPGNPVAYYASDEFVDNFRRGVSVDTISSFTGSQHKTADNEKFVRYWYEVDIKKLNSKWIPYIKGGEFRRWYGNQDLVVDWSEDALSYYATNSTSNLLADRYRFKEGITYTSLSSAANGFRYLPPIGIFDIKGPSLVDVKDLYYVLALFNTKIATKYFNAFNSTITLQVKDVKAFPIIIDESIRSEIEKITKENVALAKEDWDCFEGSWDFTRHPLVRLANMDGIERAWERWQDECNNRFDKVKQNEEKINELFIKLYRFDNEMNSQIDDKDITIRRSDIQRDVRNLISYAVGCMFGRYSLDVDGVQCTSEGLDKDKYTTFQADKDNIIPICDDEYFQDDIVGLFVKFINVVFGKETQQTNLQFIADVLGGKGQAIDIIRNYFANEFFSNHCADCTVGVGGKRPIYWQFDSGKKGGFKALIYMHRYQQDTIARMRTDYVHEQQARYRTELEDLEARIASASTSERVKLNKQLSTLQDKATEIRQYEEKIHHLADQMIRIDLDDGVKNNYAIFQDVLAKIK